MPDDLTAAALRDALTQALGDNHDSDVVETLMRTLDEKKLFRYHKDEPVALLSTPGRVLMSIMQDPTMTQRAISVYIGCSETLVDKTVKMLVEAGLVTKTKVNRQNVYQIHPDKIRDHSDTEHLRDAFELLDLLKKPKKIEPAAEKTAPAAEKPKVSISPRRRPLQTDEPF
jgi:predicted transcriptional regulator